MIINETLYILSHNIQRSIQFRHVTHVTNVIHVTQVLIDPPWEEYVRRAPGAAGVSEPWGWKEIQALDIGAIADAPAFVFLWHVQIVVIIYSPLEAPKHNIS